MTIEETAATDKASLRDKLTDIISHRVFGLIARLVLAGVLLVAGFAKFLEGSYAAQQAINAYKIFPPSWSPFLGYALPTLEVVVGLLLLVGLFIRTSALITAVVMFLFILGIASVWARGYSIDCGCFGGGGEVSPEGKTWRYTSEILRDLLFAGLAVRLWIWPHTLWAVENINAGHTYLEEHHSEEVESHGNE